MSVNVPRDPQTGVKPGPQSRKLERLETDNRWHIGALDVLFDMGALYGDRVVERDVEAILDATRGMLDRVAGCRRLGFLLVDDVSAEFKLRRCYPGSERESIQRQVDALIDSGDFAWALNRNEVQEVDFPGSGRAVLLNVIATRNRTRGMLILEPDAGTAITPAFRKLVSVMMHHCAYALESVALYQLVEQQKQRLESALIDREKALEFHTRHDRLTGLPNRKEFVRLIEQALLEACLDQSRVAVIYLNLVMFRRIHASYGYDEGDRILVQVGTILSGLAEQPVIRRALGPNTASIRVSRVGGSLFGLLLTGLRDIEAVTRIAEAISGLLQIPFELANRRVYIDHNLGVSLYPDSGGDPENLMRDAMLAGEQAASLGRNTYCVFGDDTPRHNPDSIALEAELREALNSDQMIVYYQPKVALSNGRISGAEALVRWQHPVRGLVPPGEFVQLAEYSGLIERLGEVVMAKVCAQAADWRRRLDVDFRIAVNLSPLQFRQNGLVEQIRQCVREHDASPHWLELEITESAISQDVDSTAEALDRFHREGFRLAIDDFGTGYSSLSLIRRFPIDTLKIDRSFIRELESSEDDAAIVSAVVALGHNLRLTVVAEGVESQHQFDALHRLGCDEIQGYLLGRPMPAGDFERFILSR